MFYQLLGGATKTERELYLLGSLEAEPGQLPPVGTQALGPSATPPSPRALSMRGGASVLRRCNLGPSEAW